MSNPFSSMIDRRGFLGAMGTGAAALAATPLGLASAEAQAQRSPSAPVPRAPVRTRTIPRTGQTLTALGLGTFLTFDARPGYPREHLREVFRSYVAAGGRVVDTSPLYGAAEVNVGAFLAGTLEASEIFMANKIWSTGEYLGDESHALASFEQSKLRLWRSSLDLLQCHGMVNAQVIVPLTQAWKKEGQIRYVGITHHGSGPLCPRRPSSAW